MFLSTMLRQPSGTYINIHIYCVHGNLHTYNTIATCFWRACAPCVHLVCALHFQEGHIPVIHAEAPKSKCCASLCPYVYKCVCIHVHHVDYCDMYLCVSVPCILPTYSTWCIHTWCIHTWRRFQRAHEKGNADASMILAVMMEHVRITCIYVFMSVCTYNACVRTLVYIKAPASPWLHVNILRKALNSNRLSRTRPQHLAYTRTYTHAHDHLHTCTKAPVHVSMCTHMHIQVCTYTQELGKLGTYTHTYLYAE